MKRRAFSRALAVVIGLIAVSLPTTAAAADNGGSASAPKSLTHHFPLGSKTLSRTKTVSGGGSAPARHRATPTTPRAGSTATPQGPRTQPVRRPGGHTVSSILLALVIPVLILVAILSRAAIRRSRRTVQPGASRRLLRLSRSTAGARWAEVDTDDVERKPPPLPLRRRGK
jgi:hypothetical protein